MKSDTTLGDTMSITLHRNRYLRNDGMVGIVIQPRYGIGFSTAGPREMCTDPQIVEWVLQMDEIYRTIDQLPGRADDLTPQINSIQDKIYFYCREKYNFSYTGHYLEVVWIPPHTRYIIHNYDGAEEVWTEHSIDWMTT